MKKVEIIWRELLYQAIEKNKRQFTQKKLAQKFGFSTSTVFQALKAPRKMGAIRVTGRFFIFEDPEKLLYHWASVRSLKKDVIFSGHVGLPILKIEGKMPPEIIFGGFSAARMVLKTAPADYDKIYIYTKDVEQIKRRFNFEKGQENFFVLKADKFLKNYGKKTTLAQTFVDLWNLDLWYAKEYTRALKEKVDGLLP